MTAKSFNHKEAIMLEVAKACDSNVSENVEIECKTHGKYLGNLYLIPKVGKKFESKCPLCLEDENKKQELRKLEEDKWRINQNIDQALIPKKFSEASFYNFDTYTQEKYTSSQTCQRYADNFKLKLDTGDCLTLCGYKGTGKTHLACAIANKLLQEGFSVLFTTAGRAMRSVKQTYSKTSEVTEQYVLDSYLKYDLLIVDEVGVQYGSESEKIIFFEILNSRYEQMLPTICISNLAKVELQKYLGFRVVDRLSEGGSQFLTFSDPSYRLRNQ